MGQRGLNFVDYLRNRPLKPAPCHPPPFFMPIEFNSGSPNAAPDPAKTRLNVSLLRMGIIILPLLFVLLLKSLWFDTTLVISDSMLPALKKGDYLLTDHRLSLRKTWQRGDIVIFTSPESWDSRGETLVKRIVGMPGEIVSYDGGRLQIERKPVAEPYLRERPDNEFRAPVTLGKDQYWVLGDNRNASDDSSENGPISEADIQSRAVYRVLPWSRRGSVGGQKATLRAE